MKTKRMFFLIVFLLPMTKLFAKAGKYDVFSEINADRTGLTLYISNNTGNDLYCDEMRLSVEYCSSNFCEVIARSDMFLADLYIPKQQTEHYQIEKASVIELQENQGTAVISQVLSIDSSRCKPANFESYCSFAKKTTEEEKTLAAILEFFKQKTCVSEELNWDWISLKGQEIVDLKPLSYLKHLERLDLSDNRVFDITPLSGIKTLWNVNVEKNNLNSLKALWKLPLITRVNAGNNPLTEKMEGNFPATLRYLSLPAEAGQGLCSNKSSNNQDSLLIECEN